MKGTVIVTCARSGSTALRVVAELLDGAEDVVPAAGVQPGRVLAQLVEDLLHLEGGEDGLDQHRGADGAARDAERVLRGAEDVVPEPRLEVALELGQVEVGAAAARQQLAGVVEEVEAEVEEARRDRLAVEPEVLLDQVPAARPHEERRDAVAQAVRRGRRGSRR